MEHWKNVLHILVTVFLNSFASNLVLPTIADVTMDALCPGKDECSIAIYLTGLQQAIGGLGSVFLMPIIGNLSDSYGRKLLLAIPLLLAVIPTATLAISRTTEFFFIYYVLKTLTAMVTEGGVICLSLGYLADYVPEGKRVLVFGILSGVVSAAGVCSTLAARLLPTAQIFQVAAVLAAAAAGYMRIFLSEKPREVGLLDEPILIKPPPAAAAVVNTESDKEGALTTTTTTGCQKTKVDVVMKKISLPKAIIRLLKDSSSTLALVAGASFFNSLAEAGIQSFLTYYLKARFHFAKNQFADISLITSIAATVSSMAVMPVLGAFMGEETMLCIGLFSGFLNMFLDSIAWAPWVPYASAFLGVLTFLGSPSIRCIISKQVGPYEQGIAQGCLMGLAAFANVISPLIYSPLSALFLSEGAPFNYPGFCMLCVGFAYLIAFVLGLVMKLGPVVGAKSGMMSSSSEPHLPVSTSHPPPPLSPVVEKHLRRRPSYLPDHVV